MSISELIASGGKFSLPTPTPARTWFQSLIGRKIISSLENPPSGLDDGEIFKWCRKYKYECAYFLKEKWDEQVFKHLNKYQSRVEELGREKFAFEQKIKALKGTIRHSIMH